jgi:hypothetical protein
VGDLEKMILAKRENAFGGFLNYMESKYGDKGPKDGSGKKRKAADVTTTEKAAKTKK